MKPEQLYKSTEVARIMGMSKRWLADQIRAGKFPKPDFPATSLGESHRWLESTITRVQKGEA